MNTPKDFQRYTAKRIVELFTKKDQYRVLLADEVGLGKTTVAAKVISQIAAWHRAKKDDEFNVVYVCSNLSIAQQNMRSLGFDEKDTLSLGDSRLSMQHLKIAERRMENDRHQHGMRWNSIPLTPSTSFSMTFGNGTAAERALIRVLLRIYLKRNNADKRLPRMGWMAFYATSNWEWYCNHYEGRVDDLSRNGSDYVDTICDLFHEKLQDFPTLIDDIYNCGGDYYNPEKNVSSLQCDVMRNLRKIFAQISISMLKPDLVVMDEFQRFSDLISSSIDGKEESEVATLFRHFINSNNELHTKVLLLSATPYKPFSTIDELVDGKDEDHYTGFFKVIDFLYEDKTRQDMFREKWHQYSDALSSLTNGNDTVLRVKKEAESSLYHVMCRTERQDIGMKEIVLPDYNEKGVYPTSEYLAFAEMDKLIHWAKANGGHLTFSHVPVDYVKSSPYLMSFMQNYRLKKDIDNVLDEYCVDDDIRLPFEAKSLYINWNSYKTYSGLPMQNAKLEALRTLLLGEDFRNGPAALLWVPASNPYYKVPKSSVFSKQKDFSKTLIFSAWEMVPRMLSTILSYEALCQVMKVLHKNYPNKRFVQDTDDSPQKQKVQIDGDQRLLLSYPSVFLSSIYNPEDYYNQEIDDIRKDVKTRILERITVSSSRSQSYAELLEAVKLLDTDEKVVISNQHVPALVNMAIASPGICMERIFTSAEKAQEAAGYMLEIFNSYALRVIDAYFKEGTRIEKILRYCVEGNLASVLDEYAHMVGGAENFVHSEFGDSCSLERATHRGGSTLEVDMIRPVRGELSKIIKERVPVNIAVAFSQTKQDDKTALTITNVREKFNSPFRPFILASTSVGQEGLDFHKYSRRIVHWNLPSNPVDLEQREGRINRYECLAIRRNIAKRFAAADCFYWDDMFKRASEALKGDSDMIPYWYLPKSFYDDDIDYEMIERVIPQYPYSYDQGRYKRLIDVLSLYRLTLGQPKQEELIKILKERKLSKEDVDALLINLSPIKKQSL